MWNGDRDHDFSRPTEARQHGIEPPLFGFTVGLLLSIPRCLLIGLRLRVGSPPCQRFGPDTYCSQCHQKPPKQSFAYWFHRAFQPWVRVASVSIQEDWLFELSPQAEIEIDFADLMLRSGQFPPMSKQGEFRVGSFPKRADTAPAAPTEPNFPRFPALALFRRRPSVRAESYVMPASEKAAQSCRSRRCRAPSAHTSATDIARHSVALRQLFPRSR